MNTVESLKTARDTAQAAYIDMKKAGTATTRELDKARMAYLLAQDELRAAMVKARK